ncbi:MAG: GDYXXLXY domain-containing protein, partial [Pseudomonadales bacterium]|nr:GDYXXLXY domain-containing protein [Pseudomonadales bacterium]
MNNRQRKFAFAAAILFQLVIMAGVWVNGFYPLWLGEEVRLKTRPVDPRDLFRGNYARLHYDFDTIEPGESADFRPGDVVDVPLVRNGDLWDPQPTQASRPESGVFLRGRVTSRPWRSGSRVTFGIEALFAPKEKA